MNIKVLLFVFIALLFATPNAFAANGKIGANLERYSKPKPKTCNINIPHDYPTIQQGINASSNGDIICVGQGIYNEDLVIDKEIRLSGRGYNLSKIQGQDQNASGTVYITSKNVIFEGFFVQGVGHTRGSGAVRQFENVENSIVRFNYIVAGDGQLAFLTDNAQQNNLIEHNILKGKNSPNLAKVNAFDSNKPTNKVDFINNMFVGSLQPTDFEQEVFALDDGAPNSSILRNTFHVTGTMRSLVATNPTSQVHENNFSSGPLWKVASTWGDFVNAENNWWGDLNPSDNVQGSVDYTPFAKKPFKEF